MKLIQPGCAYGACDLKEGRFGEWQHKEKKVNNSLKCSPGRISMCASCDGGAWQCARVCVFFFFFFFLHSAFSTARLSEGGIILYRHISCFPEDSVKRVILLRSAEPY